MPYQQPTENPKPKRLTPTERDALIIKRAEQRIAQEQARLQKAKENQKKRDTRMKILFTTWIISNLKKQDITLTDFVSSLIDDGTFEKPNEELQTWIDLHSQTTEQK